MSTRLVRSAPNASHARERAHAGNVAADMRWLGEALSARSEEVLGRTLARAEESGSVFEGEVGASLEKACTVATSAVATWLRSGSPETGLNAGRGAWHLFGWLAAQRTAGLDDVTRRCLYWRDSAGEVLRDSAEQLAVSPEALSQALAIMQLTIDFTLVRICEAFEAERRRAEQEHAGE